MIVDRLADLMSDALTAARRDGLIGRHDEAVEFERPRRREHGDWSTNVALAAAAGRGNPRTVAQALVERIPASPFVERVEIAGPGFINFYLSPHWLHDVVTRAADAAEPFGRSDYGEGTRINLEYVSANPTGPINVVSGRHAAVGDALGNLLEATGYAVTREFYLNDSGRQIDLFAQSVGAHYLRAFGVAAEVPDDGYKGDYIGELGREIADDIGTRLVDVSEEMRTAALAELALGLILHEVRATLARFGCNFDVWFSERTLHEAGAVKAAVEELRARDLAYENDGALWFRSSQFGDDKDRVLVRSNGETTYLAADAAYLKNKFTRGFDHLLYLWGADHHGTVARLLGMSQALGYAQGSVEVQLVQIVSLSRDDEVVKGSKRAGVFVSLDELIDEVGVDAARYIFLTRSLDAPLDFDIEAAKTQAPENPVFYVQYAHARISSIMRKAAQDGVPVPEPGVDLSPLHHESEDRLMRKLATYEEVVPEAARARAPHRISRYVEELASDFSAFYRDCRVVSEEAGLTQARLLLCAATKRVIADALGLLGVGAPERM